MPLFSLRTLVALCAALPLSAWAVHGALEGVMSTEAASTKWGDPPPVLAKGAKFTVVAGDPGKQGSFVVRLSVPAGYSVAPHWHSNAENVTVLSGSFMLGVGDKVDPKAMQTYKTGDFFSIAAKTHHYARAKTAAMIQLHGEGPFDLTYVNPDDDPQKKMAKK